MDNTHKMGKNADTTMEIDHRIEKFIRRHHVLTLATATNDGAPYCCNAFYAYDGNGGFIFTSGAETHHAAMMSDNSRVAASVVLETRIVGKVQGLQITGRALRTDDDTAKRIYIKRFPYAALADLTLWRLEADMLKYTDNTLGFGKKLIWQREE